MDSARLKIIAIISYILLGLLAIYFKFFPISINSLLVNFFVCSSVIVFIGLMVYGLLTINKPKHVLYLIPQSLAFVFLARAVPNLRLSYPPLHDPYYHYVCSLNILKYGTLEPILNWWYPQINMQLHWPNMHLINAALVKVSGINEMQLFRFQEPLIGIILFLAVFILAKCVTKNNAISMLAALFASLGDTIIFYQSEYHPQGLAFVYFAFLFYFYIKSRSQRNIFFTSLLILLIMVFALSHHFSSLLLGLLAIAYLVALFSTVNVPFLRDRFPEITEVAKKDYTLWGIIAVVMLSYHFFGYFSFGKGILTALKELTPSASLVTAGSQVPLQVTLLNAAKYILLFLALPSVFYIVKTKNINEYRCGLLLICVLIGGVIGTFIIFSPIDRIMGFYMPFAAIFGALTVFRLKDEWLGAINKNLVLNVVILLASVPMVTGFFNSQTPAYFFQDSAVNTHYWYSNRLPKMDQYKIAGEWTGAFISKESTIGTEFDTRTIPFYYGMHSCSNIRQPYDKNDYYFVNQKIPYNTTQYEKRDFNRKFNTIYDNGELNYFSHGAVDL